MKQINRAGIIISVLFIFSIFLIGCSETTEQDSRIVETNIQQSVEDSKETVAESNNGWDYYNLFFDSVDVSETNSEVTVESDGLPDHDTGSFPNSGNPNSISEQDHAFSFTKNPRVSASATFSRGYVFGIALNGIPLEPLTGEFYNNDRNSGWNLEWSTNNLGFDFNNAHVQPDGTYHYHGEPTSLIENLGGSEPILVGFAADGFPIYLDDLQSSYRIRSGTRPDGPSGSYDGTYVEDYEYVAGLGDLDECNGYTGETAEYPDGTYYYVISDAFPVIGRCFMGTPDSSFQHGPGGGAPSDGAGIAPSGGIGRSGSPPTEAVTACNGKSSGSSCSFSAPHGTISGSCQDIGEDLACAPAGGPPR